MLNILGQDYEVLFQTKKDNGKLEHADGLCETYSKKLIVCEFEQDIMNVENIDLYKNKVLRHEIIHAFLHESGLDSNSERARNEELVDFFAIQMPKMLKVMEQASCL